MNPDDESPRDRGRRLRAESPPEEQKLWRQLSAKRFGGFKFRRQHRIGPYFADFCCIEQRLVVELDGGQHAEKKEERRDVARSAYLQEQGYRVIRFWNEQVNREMKEVLESIYTALTDS
ncbi:MAG: endonuclease domain-containing protein [Deltaproteobacteria bacterium]|nr:endonuclease domain-containing protein [Deltaproteobacteria bacterium]